jgi:lipoprotein-releasing system ATP-binding protein
MSEFLQVRDISKRFTMGAKTLSILRGVSFDVARGEMVAVVGHSGCGKTTLLHILGTLDTPDEGAVYYGGRSLAELNGRGLEQFRNAEIGFVFQFFQLLPEFTALENVIMPLLIGGTRGAEARRIAEEVLGEVGLRERLQHYPSQLSGGEQQRAAIARALARSPNLLLADEPTGNLDVATGRSVFALLRDLQRKRSLSAVIVTHNPEIAAQCDRVLELEQLNRPE